MKITPLTNAFSTLNQVRDRKEGEGGTGQNAYENLFQKRKEDDAEQKLADEAEVKSAAEAFSAESETKHSGVIATTEGDGPGLRVVLSDAAGHRLRQMSGEEFLKMRERSSADSQKRGKILDRKY